MRAASVSAAGLVDEALPAPLLAQLTSPDRLCPVIAGQAVARLDAMQAELVVRHARGDVEVTAPAPLIEAVLALCDGSRTVSEVLEQAAENLREELSGFMAFLLDKGALIDASLYCAHALSHGFQFSPFGLAAPAELTLQISRRFHWSPPGDPVRVPENTALVPVAPLDAFFCDRTSVYTFDDVSPDLDALHTLLWSAAGIVRAEHPREGLRFPHRTLASAGAMHLLQVHLVLRRQVGAYAPGVYKIMYPGERLVRLVPVHDDLRLLPVAFSKPWELRFATGALFVTADPAIGALRYRNRSLQYLFMEAGALLHNVALTAPSLGLAQATIGGYYEAPAKQLCRIDKGLVLGSCIFGVKPTPEQRRLARLAPDIDFAWVNGESPRFSMPFFMGRARVRQADSSSAYTWGRDTDPWLAVRKAVAEAVEREGFREPRQLVRARMDEVEAAVDPGSFVRYTGEQLDEPGFPYAAFDPHQARDWVGATRLADGGRVHVSAELVFAQSSLRRLSGPHPRPIGQASSSGCAAGLTWADAVHRAIRELIERDAFMRHWLAQQPGVTLEAHTGPAALAERMSALEAAGCRLTVQRLHSRWLPVAMVSVQHDDEHFTTLGLAAHEDFSVAVEAATDEVEARVYAWLHGHRPSIAQAAEVRTTEHHFELYGLPAFYRQADAVLFPREGVTAPWPEAPDRRGPEALVAEMAATGIDLYSVDITPNAHAIDQGRTPLHVARVLAAGLLPISFGHRLEPLGLVREWHPHARHPHPFP